MRVLIADDVPTNRIVLRNLIARRGHEVLEAGNGQEALDVARSQQPDLIVTDLLMPVMDGFALCRACKADSALSSIPIIFYSGTYTSNPDREFGDRLGASGFFVKPREQELLLNRIDALRPGPDLLLASRETEELVAETDYLRAHNEALTRKLREKISELEAVNRALELDIEGRQRVEADLQEARSHLEHLVTQRTQALANANHELSQEIEQRQKTEQEARDLEVQLAHMARLSIAGQMAAELAHELNQPLAAITTYAQTCMMLLDADNVDRKQLVEPLELVASQAQRAGEIIRRVREFTRKTTPHKRPVSVNRLINDVFTLIKPQARSESVEVRLDLSEGLPSVEADEVQIQQVLMNLICNSLDAQRSSENVNGKALTLRSRLDESGAVHIQICDNGPGLDPKIADRLFDPFFSTKTDGMGLGLAISRSIIEAHQGRLWHEPRPAGGARFQFTLPAGAVHEGPRLD